jgi:hypothetical protein
MLVCRVEREMSLQGKKELELEHLLAAQLHDVPPKEAHHYHQS